MIILSDITLYIDRYFTERMYSSRRMYFPLTPCSYVFNEWFHSNVTVTTDCVSAGLVDNGNEDMMAIYGPHTPRNSDNEGR